MIGCKTFKNDNNVEECGPLISLIASVVYKIRPRNRPPLTFAHPPVLRPMGAYARDFGMYVFPSLFESSKEKLTLNCCFYFGSL